MDDLNLVICSYTCREQKYCTGKDDYVQKNDRPPHQKRRFLLQVKK